MKITKRQLRRVIREVVEGRSADLAKLKKEDPEGYLQAKYGEGAVLTTSEMEKEGLVDPYDADIAGALDSGDPNFKLISRDLAVYLPVWEKI